MMSFERTNAGRSLLSTEIQRSEGHFLSRQTELFYQSWTPMERGVPSARATLVLTHGMGEHSESYVKSADAIARLGWNVIAWDLRGHGRSAGKRGHVDHFTDFTSDYSQLLLHLQKNNQLSLPFAFIGHSMGGLIVLKYLIDEAKDGASDDPKPRACVLSSPLLDVAIKVPLVKEFAAKVLNQVWPSLTLFNEIRGTDLTRDPEWLPTYEKDPLRHDKISPALYEGMVETMKDVTLNADQVQLPICVLASGTDKIVSLPATKVMFERLGSPNKKMIIYQDSYHEIFNDLERDKVFQDLNAFLSSVPGLEKK
jgi:alpha-beta hydrolase superfamily lysophospholipase